MAIRTVSFFPFLQEKVQRNQMVTELFVKTNYVNWLFYEPLVIIKFQRNLF